MKQIHATILILSTILSGCISVPTDSKAPEGQAVRYASGEHTFEGYFISPSPTAPLVLLVHDWDGLTGYEIKRANMLADLGYAVFAVDLYGADVRPTEVKDKRAQTGALYKNRDQMRLRLQAALDAAKAQSANGDNAAIVGYCFGGSATLEFARSGVDLKAFIAFHGGLETPPGQDYSTTRGKILILHGTADTKVTMEHFAGLAVELETQKIDHEMISYSGAPHAFSVFGSPRYREDADRKSWKRFTDFLAETLAE